MIKSLGYNVAARSEWAKANVVCKNFTASFPIVCNCSLISGNSNVSQCIACTSGSYCQGTGNIKPTGPCDAGFFCPSGQSNKQAFSCHSGNYCPPGSPAPILCPSGQWQNETQKSECKFCPAGFYCDIANGPIVDYTIYPCPNGFYCPNGTRYSTEHGCPNGTYGNGTRLVSGSECLPCQPGRYCHGMLYILWRGFTLGSCFI